ISPEVFKVTPNIKSARQIGASREKNAETIKPSRDSKDWWWFCFIGWLSFRVDRSARERFRTIRFDLGFVVMPNSELLLSRVHGKPAPARTRPSYTGRRASGSLNISVTDAPSPGART